MNTKTIFLSSTSDEFGPLRTRLANLLTRGKLAHARHEPDFASCGTGILLHLAAEIQASDVVLHLIGAEPGGHAPVAEVEQFLSRHRNFATIFPDQTAAARNGTLSWTQWEVWMALYFRKAVAAFCLDPALHSLAPTQLAHRASLRAIPLLVPDVATADALYDASISAFVNFRLFSHEQAAAADQRPTIVGGTIDADTLDAETITTGVMIEENATLPAAALNQLNVTGGAIRAKSIKAKKITSGVHVSGTTE